MLMDRAQAQAKLPKDHINLKPVPGLVDDNLPTTGDVHLYADPATYYDQSPILFADSEGMTGGENTPRGIEFCSTDDSESAKKARNLVKDRIIKRLSWGNEPKKNSREFAVKSLFPRILYTFSDVIVFVLREARIFEDVLHLLVEWAAVSISKSVNQPSRPHVIIVLNAAEMTTDDRQWEPEFATDKLLEDYKDSVNNVPYLQNICSSLKLSRSIKTTKDLLNYYYLSVTVLKIPRKGHYMQIDAQLIKLYDNISSKCAESHDIKKRTRMLLNAERLPRYVNAAYDHFTQDLDEPFDFVTEARRDLSPPQDFGGHVLNFILFMYDQWETTGIPMSGLFYRLAEPIASCVMLAATRDKTQGGVRGIIELVILREIEMELGDHLPIQSFFDLIVGTSAGGILALGLGVKNWPVSECTSQFKGLCKQAFTKRAPRLFNTFTAITGKGLYRSKAIESALRSAFGNNSLLYGRALHTRSTSIRVAVTTTLAREDRAAVLSNYNTECRSEKLPYVFIRPQDPTQELKVWEAARATSAAPPYFKPFIQGETMRAYTDGAIHHHCPVFIADQERRLLWEDVKDWPPDIVLSIGSGFRTAEDSSSPPETMEISTSDGFFNRRPRPRRAVAGLGYLWRTANKIIEKQLDCEEIWRSYSSQNKSAGDKMRYGDENRNIRLNVHFANELPALDDVKAMDGMEHLAKLMVQETRREIQKVAEKLIASCFYFETVGPAFRNTETGRFQCRIHCRFHDVRDIQGLGKILLRYCSQRFVPSFLIKENYGSRLQKYYKESFSITTIENMASRGIFTPLREISIEAIDLSSQTNICLCLHSDNSHVYGVSQELFTTPLEISGFPRNLCALGAFDVCSPGNDIKNAEKEYEKAPESIPGPKSGNLDSTLDMRQIGVHMSENTSNSRRVSADSEPGTQQVKLRVPWVVRCTKNLIPRKENRSQFSFKDNGMSSNSSLTVGLGASSSSVGRSERANDSWVAENSHREGSSIPSEYGDSDEDVMDWDPWTLKRETEN
ncbi:hypothetical protein TrVGV298_007100 [Trichoderma virens]|nr:hypothetical protein TrVGV298_007100 [Trichoderma virens]